MPLPVLRPGAASAACLLPLLVLFTTAFAPAVTATTPVEPEIRDLLSRMTLEEKVGQLVQNSSRSDMTGPPSQAAVAPDIASGKIGSLLNITGAAETRKWQKLAVDSSRLHIPLLFGYDVIHGYQTVFPIPLATAASWDLDHIEAAERIAATEASAAGVHWTFAPMVDVARDPRWGRMSEGSGEDPVLGAAIARARVHGFQGDDLAATNTLLACAKHFAAYGAAQAGRDYFTVDVSNRTLREVYMPPFHAAVDAGVGTLMAAFNDLNGTPCSANEFLLTHVLRDEWHFPGFVVSDWAGIDELRAHGIAVDQSEAARLGFSAGVDMDMEGGDYTRHLAELVRRGAVSPARLDAAVAAVLTAKKNLGLFADPFRYSDEAREKATLRKPEFLDAARDMARRSCVLLKNANGILPLKTSGLNIALVGPLAAAPLQQLGAWHGRGREADTVTVRTALERVYGTAHVHYAFGGDVRGHDTTGIPAAVAAASNCDVIIAALGEAANQSGEAASRVSLDFSGPQLQLLQALHETGKPIVLLMMSGRPLMLESVEPLVNAILVAWHPGTMGGPAITDVLTGAFNPSGHLPVTWPRSVGQIPIFYAHKSSGRPGPNSPSDLYYSRYIDSPNTPQYPFGFGLSYTTFAFDQLRLSSTSIPITGGSLSVTVRLSNTGTLAGADVVQLYVHDRVGSVTRPVRELKSFRRVELAPGESCDVTFQLTPADLAFWRADMTFGPEAGDFDIYIGDSSTATLSSSFHLDASAPR